MIFRWDRLLRPLENSEVTDSLGFVQDRSDWIRGGNTFLKTMRELRPSPCIVVVGEPFIGKTTLFRHEHSDTEPGQKSSFVDLGAHSCSSAVRSALESIVGELGADVELFLDALDTHLVYNPSGIRFLADFLPKLLSDGTKVRLACRARDWRNTLGQVLPKGCCHVLVGLTQAQVREAAVQSRVEPEQFLNAIRQAKLGSFAARPGFLIGYLQSYKDDGKLSASPREVFLKNSLHLCDESEEKLDVGCRPRSSLTERFDVATRIMATLQICGKRGLWTGPETKCPVDFLPKSVLVGGMLTDQRPIGEQTIDEAINTGLFTITNPNCHEASHAQFREFLAAHFLAAQNFPISRYLELIATPEQRRVAPALAETSAWLALQNEEFRTWLCRHEPDILLSPQFLSEIDDPTREEVLESILGLFERNLLRDKHGNSAYAHFAHPALAAQLRPYLQMGADKWLVRRVCAQIATATGQSPLFQDLLKIALDVDDFIPTREAAAHAALALARPEQRVLFKPLCFTVGEKLQELKAVGIEACWPDHLSEFELQGILEPPQEHFVGNYRMLIGEGLVRRCTTEDHITKLLTWALQIHEADYIVDVWLATLQKTVEEFLSDRTLRLAGQLFLRLQNLDGQPKSPYISASWFKENLGGRRRVLEWVLDEGLCADPFPYFGLFHPQAEDFGWAVSKYYAAETPSLRLGWRAFLCSFTDFEQSAECEALIRGLLEFDAAFEKSRLLEAWTRWRETNAPNIHARGRRRRFASSSQEAESIKITDVSLPRSIPILSWPEAVNSLRELYSGRQLDITELPKYEQLAESYPHPVLAELAARYLAENAPGPERGRSGLDLDAMKALTFCLVKTPGVSLVGSDVLARWLPLVLEFSQLTSDPTCGKLLRACQAELPQEFDGQWLRITGVKGTGRLESVFWTIRPSDAVLEPVFAKLQAEQSLRLEESPMFFALVASGYEPAVQYCRGAVASDSSDSPAFLKLLLLGQVKLCYREVCDYCQRQPDSARQAVLEISSQLENVSLPKEAEALALLYEAFSVLLPQNAYFANVIGAHWVDDKMAAAQFRDGLVRALSNLGSNAACEQLARLIERFPEQKEELHWVLIDAQTGSVSGEWIPPTVAEFVLLVSNTDARRVQNEEQLRGAVIESLLRLEQKLQGETPLARYLWNESPDEWTPKDENAFSDFIKNHLVDELRNGGVIINREVEIRREQRTDLLVEAATKPGLTSPNQVLRLVVEVKGSWHSELWDALDSQLTERYLSLGSLKTGLYLVGWFDCDDSSGLKCASTKRPKTFGGARVTMDQGKATLAEQARAIVGVDVEALVLDCRIVKK